MDTKEILVTARYARFPHSNSLEEWAIWFQTNRGVAAGIQVVLDRYGKDVAVCRFGKKPVKFYERFTNGR